MKGASANEKSYYQNENRLNSDLYKLYTFRTSR